MSMASDRDDVTLFRGAADNSYFAVYFNALPSAGAEDLEPEWREIDLRPERDMTLHVEIYNPEATIPLVVTPGGMGECDGFRGFARNVAAAAPDLRVIIWDRRNMGRSGVNFGTEPFSIEEAEDLHVLIDHLGVAPATLYGMSSGSRSNMVLAERYPDDVAALVIAPLTGGPIAASRLPEEYHLKYLDDPALTSMEAVGETPLWSAYLARNGDELRRRFLEQDIDDFLAAQQRSGEHLQSFRHKVTLGMSDEQLAALEVPATLILHHGDERDELHPIPNGLAATTLLQNSSFVVAETLGPILEVLLPFVREHTPPIADD
ncbi:MAG: alpha/beta hydrolase [Actinomycetota bacterium]